MDELSELPGFAFRNLLIIRTHSFIPKYPMVRRHEPHGSRLQTPWFTASNHGVYSIQEYPSFCQYIPAILTHFLDYKIQCYKLHFHKKYDRPITNLYF